MSHLTKSNWLILIYISGSIIASGVTFISVPLAIHYLGEEKFSQLSLWAIFLVLARILDFGICQSTIKHSSSKTLIIDKIFSIQESNKAIMVILLMLLPFSLLIPKPQSQIYNSVDFVDWTILKIAAILNLKVMFNQSAITILNRQLYYTLCQIILAFVYFILPIFIYLFCNDFTVVNLYFLISSVFFIILTDILIGINSLSFYRLRDISKIVSDKLAGSLLLYFSAIVSILLSVLDRFIASNFLSSFDYTEYFGNFALASAVNIVILPFYRLFIAKMRYGYYGYNRKYSLRITNIQSYICLITIACLLMYSEYAFRIMGINFKVDLELLSVISISLWGAANGWILATDIMMNRKPTIQAWLILLAMSLYAFYLAIQSSISNIDLAMVWVIHGLIQTFICPIWLKESFSWRSYVLWLKYVVFIPGLAVGSIFLVSYSVIIWSYELSALVFVVGVAILFSTITKHSLFDKKIIQPLASNADV
jgi:O-antigen/teichoic acid export membrane protein